MKRLLLLSTILMAAAAVLSATPLPCVASTTLGALIATNGAGGCTSQGLIFSNFAYTQGTSSVTAAKVLATLVIDDTPGQTGDGWTFGPSSGWGSSTSVTFGLSFTVTVNPVQHSGVTSMNQTVDQIFAGAARSTNNVTATDTESAGITPHPVSLSATTGAGMFGQTDMYTLNTVSTSTNFSVASLKDLNQYRQVFYSTSVPEPVTFLLIGSGLIGLAFLRRRSQKS